MNAVHDRLTSGELLSNDRRVVGFDSVIASWGLRMLALGEGDARGGGGGVKRWGGGGANRWGEGRFGRAGREGVQICRGWQGGIAKVGGGGGGYFMIKNRTLHHKMESFSDILCPLGFTAYPVFEDEKSKGYDKNRSNEKLY